MCVAWLSACRVTAIIALVLQLVCLTLFIILVVFAVSQFISCAAIQDELCQRVLLYSTPITCILAGRPIQRYIPLPVYTVQYRHAYSYVILIYAVRIFVL